MAEIIRAIVEGLGFGLISASCLTVYTHRAVPRVWQMGRLERSAWAVFVASVIGGSLIAIGSLMNAGSLHVADPSARRLLLLAWLLPIAVVLVHGFRRRPPRPVISSGAPPTVGSV